MVSRSAFDFAFSRPGEANQEVVVPDTETASITIWPEAHHPAMDPLRLQSKQSQFRLASVLLLRIALAITAR